MKKTIKHSNGYIGILYGKRSFVIKDPSGKEVMHTGFRSCETKKEVLEILEEFPKLRQSLDEMMNAVLTGKLKQGEDI